MNSIITNGSILAVVRPTNDLKEKGGVILLTFIIGLVVLLVGADFYSGFCEKVFGPDGRKTPAYTKQDGVDYVPMKGWKNSLINLLNRGITFAERRYLSQ